MKDQFRKGKNRFDAFIRYSSLGFEMMVMIAFGTFLGFKLDEWLENDFKWFTLVLMVLSVIGSLIYFIRKLLK